MYDDIKPEHEHEAWEAFNEARRKVPVVQPNGAVKYVTEWEMRGAPSVGARAASRIRNLLYPPSYVERSLRALKLYLSDAQLSERTGFYRPRKGLSLV